MCGMYVRWAHAEQLINQNYLLITSISEVYPTYRTWKHIDLPTADGKNKNCIVHWGGKVTTSASLRASPCHPRPCISVAQDSDGYGSWDQVRSYCPTHWGQWGVYIVWWRVLNIWNFWATTSADTLLSPAYKKNVASSFIIVSFQNRSLHHPSINRSDFSSSTTNTKEANIEHGLCHFSLSKRPLFLHVTCTPHTGGGGSVFFSSSAPSG